LNNCILGLDLSSVTCGWAITEKKDDQISIIDCGYFRINEKNIYNNAKKSIKNINSIIQHNSGISKIVIEEPSKKFASGKSTINTIIRLVSINSIVSYSLNEKFSIEHLSAVRSRKLSCGTTFMSKKERQIEYENIKKQYWRKHHIFEKIVKLYPEFKKFIKFKINKKTGEDELDPYMYDVCDAIVLSIAGHYNNE
jgi:Holliday junction resolvasome RuvABC endonuclease subunit